MVEYKNIPAVPGIYLFKDKSGEIIYVGKAKSLRSRIAQYFQNKHLSLKTQHLVAHIVTVDYIVVNNELEALLLENKQIKKHKPKYNILLKDSKTYAYIKVTAELLPRVISTRILTKKGTYFGPYTNGNARVELVKLTNQLFKLRTQKNVCKKPCLNYYLNLCSAPCVGKISREDYAKSIESAKRFLKGKTKEIELQLFFEMKKLSVNQHFEQAQIKKKQLDAIAHLKERQTVDVQTSVNQDIFAFVDEGNMTIISILHSHKGVITNHEEYRLETQDDFALAFVKEYYSTRVVPREIISSKAFDDTALINYLSFLRQGPVMITVPQQGQKFALLELAQKNSHKTEHILFAVQRELSLPALPTIIECFDISNLGREHIVAGMVRFVNGTPDLSGYRRFAMQTISAQNDFAAMHEAVLRRYTRLKKENGVMPNLIIIDGGKGQLSFACVALKSIGFEIPIVALAKENEELYSPNKETSLQLDKNSEVMLFIRGIRDRVHNYALAYNKQKRKIRVG